MDAVLAQSTSGPGLGLPIGGFITLALLVVTFFLIKNMAGRLNRLPSSFDPVPSAQDQVAEDAPPEPPASTR